MPARCPWLRPVRFQCHAAELVNEQAPGSILLPHQATGLQSRCSVHTMHKSMTLIRRLEAASRCVCMFGHGNTRSRDGEVDSHRNSFKDEVNLKICDRKLSSGLSRMYRKGIGSECQDWNPKRLCEPKRQLPRLQILKRQDKHMMLT
jgi:hypothetical protein